MDSLRPSSSADNAPLEAPRASMTFLDQIQTSRVISRVSDESRDQPSRVCSLISDEPRVQPSASGQPLGTASYESSSSFGSRHRGTSGSYGLGTPGTPSDQREDMRLRLNDSRERTDSIDADEESVISSSPNARLTGNTSLLSRNSALSSWSSTYTGSSMFSDGRRGRLQYVSDPAGHNSQVGEPAQPSAVPGYPEDVNISLTGLAAHLEAIPSQTSVPMHDSFLVRADTCFTCGLQVLGLLCLVPAAGSIFMATSDLQQRDVSGSGDRSDLRAGAWCILALVLLLIALALFIRIRAPTSIDISRVDGAWSLTLHRRALSPVVKRLQDLEAFVETFGCYSGMRLFRFGGKRAGFPTTAGGTLHLIFGQSSGGSGLVMSCSLQEPLGFFTTLRDVMISISHDLAGITGDYVNDWGRAATQESSHSVAETLDKSRDSEGLTGSARAISE